MLIDSGATMSLLAKSTYCKLPENIRPTLEKSSFQIKFANGDIQDTFGQTRIPVHDSFDRHLSSRDFVKHMTCLPPRQSSIVWDSSQES